MNYLISFLSVIACILSLSALPACAGANAVKGPVKVQSKSGMDDGDVSGHITIAAVGDVMMGSDYPEPHLPPKGGRELLRHAKPYFRKADIAMANLEGPLSTGGTPSKVPKEGKSYAFRTPPEFADNLKDAGISMVSLANNHAYDFGQSGHSSTRKALREAGIAFSGKQGDIAEFDIRGIRVGIIALSFGRAPRSIVYPAQALSEIAEAAKSYDILILSIHAGAEGRQAMHVGNGTEIFMNEPRGDLVRFAHDAVDRGTALVIAHGPHVPRAMEVYKGRLIAYSLGNFCTYGGINVSRENGYAPRLLAEIDRTGAFRGGKLLSFIQRPLQGPQPDPQQRALDLIRELTRHDFPDSGLFFSREGDIAAVPSGRTAKSLIRFR